MTFSIVAWDPRAEPSPEWGVAVASKFLAVGSVVPWVAAGAGAVATQAYANLSYGPEGLERLAGGSSAADVLAALTAADAGRARRQIGAVDARGGAHNFTGEECFEWAGGTAGEGYCCQGNILTGAAVIERMAATFEAAEGELAQRLLAALAAGDAAGGDRRGRQSAALVIARAGGGYGGLGDLAVNLRVDDHHAPLGELERLYGLHRLYFPRPGDLEFIPLDDSLVSKVRRQLAALGFLPEGGEGGYDRAFKQALFAYTGTENLEERHTDERKIETGILGWLDKQTGA
jgi:uncharacterized Ntn-hydrolase superfamily protein